MAASDVLPWLACACCALACSSFASSTDMPMAGAGNLQQSGGASPIGGFAQAVPPEPLPTAPGGNETPALGTSSDAGAGALDPVPADPADPADPPDAGVAAPLDAGASVECNGEGELTAPDGASCYRWVTEAKAWSDARTDCLEWGGDLARADSAEEDLFLTGYMLLDSWLGASDLAEEGTFTWADGSALTFTNWTEQQPDDFQGAEDCVEKLARNGAWNDQQCAKLNAYFCERGLR